MKWKGWIAQVVRGALLLNALFIASCNTTTPLPADTIIPTPTLAPTAAPSQGRMLWSGDFETGDFSQWTVTTDDTDDGGIYNTGTGRALIATDIVHSGKFAAKLRIKNADGRHGPQAVRIFRKEESQTYSEAYYSVWFYFPRIYRPEDSWNIFQFKSKSETQNSVFWKLEVRNRPNGEMYLLLRDKPNNRNYEQSIADLPVKQWVHVEVYYKQSANDTGHITLWQDGMQLADVDGITTMFADATKPANWSVNNYTSHIHPENAVIYIDDAVISTARIGR